MRARLEEAAALWLLHTRGVLLGLAAVVFIAGCPSAVVHAVVGRLECSNSDRAWGIDLPAIAQGIETHRAKTGRTPATLDELVTAGLFEKLPMDPWDRPYLYVQTVNGPKVLSLGKDGAPGGCGAHADHERFIDEPGRNVPTLSQRGEERSWVFKLDVPPRQACR